MKALAKLSQVAEEPRPDGYCKVIVGEKPVLRTEHYVLTSILRPNLQLSLHSSFKFIKLNLYYILFHSAGIFIFLTGTEMKHNPFQAENSEKNLTYFQMDTQQSPRGITEKGKMDTLD